MRIALSSLGLKVKLLLKFQKCIRKAVTKVININKSRASVRKQVYHLNLLFMSCEANKFDDRLKLLMLLF